MNICLIADLLRLPLLASQMVHGVFALMNICRSLFSAMRLLQRHVSRWFMECLHS
jgi:hypothetical protein